MENNLKWSDFVVEKLADKKFAKAYLQEALQEFQQDGDKQALLIALWNLAQANGGIAVLAKKIHVGRESLYKTLSENGNPRFETIAKIISALGCQFSLKMA